MLSDEEIEFIHAATLVDKDTIRMIAQTMPDASIDQVAIAVSESHSFVDATAGHFPDLGARERAAMYNAYERLKGQYGGISLVSDRCDFSTQYSENQVGLQCGKHAMMALLKTPEERRAAEAKLPQCLENMREDDLIRAIRNVPQLNVADIAAEYSLAAVPILLGMPQSALQAAFRINSDPNGHKLDIRGLLVNVGGHFVAIRREDQPSGLVCLYKIDSLTEEDMRNVPVPMETIIDYMASLNWPTMVRVFLVYKTFIASTWYHQAPFEIDHIYNPDSKGDIAFPRWFSDKEPPNNNSVLRKYSFL